MATIPRDSIDLFLAPVALAVDLRIAELGAQDDVALARRVALEGDHPAYSRALRISGLLQSLSHPIDMHGWELSWEERGIGLSHSERHLVLGAGEQLRRYVEHTSP